VDLDMGSVSVEVHDESVVSVEAGPAETISLSVEREGDDVQVEGEPGACFAGLASGASPRVHVKVPRQFSVDVETRGGRIHVSGVGGRVAAETGGGQIALRDVSGPMMLRSAGGAIRIQSSQGDLRARTLGGAIVVKDLHGSVDLKSGGGSIRASEISGSVEARTGAGLIVASFSENPSGSLETGAGSIVVNLRAGVGAEIDARTGAGRVRLDRGLPFQGRRSRSQLVGTLGEGGEPLRLRAVLGAIHLRERRTPNATDEP
jgi:DUF4097 and DUF4098 domain-containing protein YvlB